MLCDECNFGMRLVDTVSTGNMQFQTYQCRHCMNRKTTCKF
ncbi:MAG: hypothetical protein ABIC91_01135 [Nanoarchaeota archaeon]